MNVDFYSADKIKSIQKDGFTVPFFSERQGFFIETETGAEEISLIPCKTGFLGNYREIFFFLRYEKAEAHICLHIGIENRGEDFCGKIGMHVGVDTYMEKYPFWHEKFFPTLLRCEKTHLWGYYMNTEENALAIATSDPVASYDIVYNYSEDSLTKTKKEGLHRILGTDILFYQNTVLPERHPQKQKILRKGESYRNTIFFIPVEKKGDIKRKLSSIAEIPLVDSEKYTKEPGELLQAEIFCNEKTTAVLSCPDGTIKTERNSHLSLPGRYTLTITSENGKQCEALFFVRQPWEHYLTCAAKCAMAKPPKASTHTESFYGLFSSFLYYKHTKDRVYGEKAYAAFDEFMPYMFDMENCVPITIPKRIQNTAGLISLLTDMYEADPEHKQIYLEKASRFAAFLIGAQDETGAYRNRRKHYTCVLYIAKSMLELSAAEEKSGIPALWEKAKIHYASAKKAVDELVRNLDNIQTEGEMTLEDGMISCSALQIGMFALTLPEQEREPYIRAAEYMMKLHSCLEQQLIPDSRCNGASLRYWEAQYDVMIRVNMLNSPHGWTGWTGYAKYYLYLLTGKKEYLVDLMNLMGSCVQLIDENGELHWAYCSQPYVKGQIFVPDTEKPVTDGYQFVEANEPAYRGKYVMGEFGESYVPMISGWYRVGEQKVVGGYEFCPLIMDGYQDEKADRQGGCCDNDVHEIFKCMEETVMNKAFLHENEDGTFLCYGCKAEGENGILHIQTDENVKTLVYSLRKPYRLNADTIEGVGMMEW